MNDTILNSRQRQILKLLEEHGELSRAQISRKTITKKEVSKITVIRDLNKLIKVNLIKTKGKAKAKLYYLAQVNPLLKYVDLDHYFQLETHERNAKTNFNSNVFTHLTNLYSKSEISLWEKSKKKFQARITKLDPSVYKRELERFIIELSWKSSQIEGNTYSLIEAESLIKQHIEAHDHPKEEATMILNHKHAFDAILKHTDSFKKLLFSDVVQLHNVLTKGLVTSGIRFQPVRISGTPYKPLSQKEKIEKQLKNLIKHTNKIKYPPEKALVIATMVAYLQPFADGNKRTSRMLSNAILLAHGYYPLSYRNTDVNEYRKAMLLFYEQNNLYHFKRIFLDQLKYAVNNYFLTQ